ncbi:MAG: CRISPR-associated endonuclease/helicase Cas3 [Clostridia bacterium]|nr:CRISPR-associated endonuclease/helicase Cas3 [Clostridia bacterium]
MYSYKLRSHPNVLLKEHLEKVVEISHKIGEEKQIFFPENKDTFLKILKILGLFHDSGKATKFFQNYMDSIENKKKRSIDRELKEHGLLSALITYSVVKTQLKLKEKWLEFMPIFCFEIIKRHHGNLDDLAAEVCMNKPKRNSCLEVLEKQVESLDYEEMNKILRPFDFHMPSSEEIIDSFSEIFIQYWGSDIYDLIEEEKNIKYYIMFKYLYSILIYADKLEAIFHEDFQIKYDIPPSAVDIYKEKDKEFNAKKVKSEIKLNEIREDIYNKSIEKVETMSLDNRILHLTVPTGMGKTLASVSFSLYLKKKLKDVTNFDYKIIYALPFTSIIDQNHEVISSIIKANFGEKGDTSTRIIKHHHLAEVEYNDGETDYELDKSKYLIETWNSQIIVTTFVQLLSTIFSNRNSSILKFHNIAKSIILLDEVQSIPHDYWLLINKIFKKMAKFLDVYFVFITATQPLIFDEANKEIDGILTDKSEYFSYFNRTIINYYPEEINIQDFKLKLNHIIEENKNKKMLLVFNTIKSSQEIYKYLSDNINYMPIIYLSARVLPVHRKEAIEKIKNYDLPYIVVSTQVIEAGVDIDVDYVLRDIGPWDSIIQVAGRCNRNNKKEMGKVDVFNLMNENGKGYASMVYGSFLIEKTKQILKNKTSIEEIEYQNLSQQYFQLIKEEHSEDPSEAILRAMEQLAFAKVNDEFQIIPYDNRIPLFIEYDEKAKNLWEKYEEIKCIDNVYERKKTFLKIKSDFLQYVISIYSEEWPYTYEGGFAYLSNLDVERFYTKEMGFEVKDDPWVL